MIMFGIGAYQNSHGNMLYEIVRICVLTMVLAILLSATPYSPAIVLSFGPCSLQVTFAKRS